ncbi:NADPH:quinone reductase [Hyaloraphidium curvatum]|nr:NADPH:quinone reductase [Hyaloraphidium curvatum]
MAALPATYKRVELVLLSKNFRDATKVIDCPTSDLEAELEKNPADSLLVRNKYLGANASDIIFSAGGYNPGRPTPYTTGLEALGVVEKVGSSTKGFAPGDVVVVFTTLGGCNSELQVVKPSTGSVIKVTGAAEPDPRYLAAGLSGLTASLALEQVAHMKICKGSPLASYVPANMVADDAEPETVLVTAAVGGTGLFAVQLAKLAGNTVIGTCGTEEKREVLRKWGCDVTVNCRTEKLAEVLKHKCPNGVDIAYESVGGDLVKAAGTNLAVGGRLVIIGAIENYKEDSPKGAMDAAAEILSPLMFHFFLRSASLASFFLPNFFTPNKVAISQRHIDLLAALIRDGKLDVPVDSEGGKLTGIGAVPAAVEYLHTGRSVGKVVVKL